MARGNIVQTTHAAIQNTRSGINRRLSYLKDSTLAYMLVAPTMLVIFGLLGYPVLYSLWLSVHDVQLTRPQTGQPFVGLTNYLRPLTDPLFIAALRPTIILGIALAGSGIVVCFAFALILNEEFRGSRFGRIVLLIPWAMPGIVSAMLWGMIYSASYGILNYILLHLGLIDSYLNIFSQPRTAITALVIAETWKYIPLSTLLLMAGLGYIPEELYRAAKMDGASLFQRFTFVTLPGVRYHLMIVMILQTVHSLQTFEILYLLTQGGPGNSTMVLNYYTYKVAFGYLDLGYGSALSFILSAALIAISIAYIRMLHRQQ
jgi:multiple sugar transport system permease protein